MKKILSIVTSLMIAAGSTAAMAQTQVRIGSIQSDSFYMNKYFQKFQEIVQEKTNNAYQFKVFYNSTLGNESEMMEQMHDGGMMDHGQMEGMYRGQRDGSQMQGADHSKMSGMEMDHPEGVPMPRSNEGAPIGDERSSTDG